MKVNEGDWYTIKCPKCDVAWITEMHPPEMTADDGTVELAEWTEYICKKPLGCGCIIDVDEAMAQQIEEE